DAVAHEEGAVALDPPQAGAGVGLAGAEGVLGGGDGVLGGGADLVEGEGEDAVLLGGGLVVLAEDVAQQGVEVLAGGGGGGVGHVGSLASVGVDGGAGPPVARRPGRAWRVQRWGGGGLARQGGPRPPGAGLGAGLGGIKRLRVRGFRRGRCGRRSCRTRRRSLRRRRWTRRSPRCGT